MDDIVERLLAENSDHAAEYRDAFDDLQDKQAPDVVSVCCADSRVLHGSAWGNTDPGGIFTVGNIGNRVVQHTEAGRVVSGDILYPIEHTGTRTAVVLGHTGCGAVTATYDALTDGLDEPPGIEHCVDVLAPGLRPAVEALPEDLDRTNAINRLVEHNVDQQVQALVGSPDVPAETTVVGAVYDFQDVYSDRRGEVHVINVDGETDVDALRERHTGFADRIRRLTDG